MELEPELRVRALEAVTRDLAIEFKVLDVITRSLMAQVPRDQREHLAASMELMLSHMLDSGAEWGFGAGMPPGIVQAQRESLEQAVAGRVRWLRGD